MGATDLQVKRNGRILYVEPNDIYGDIDGSPLTPDFTDYSIYCNLMVENTSRLKNTYVGTDRTGNMSIEYDGSSGVNITEFANNGKPNNQYKSFFQGKSGYLTTDYTNIHFNEVKRREFVEGLQITSIDINYQNKFVPMVVMQMVDIHGAGLLAREEATHVNGGMANLTHDSDGDVIDNFYNCFMTFPYPRFRLMLKGYYGRMVTYQLMCQNFSAKLDGSTGNVNITVTFIGYEYGFLQDLPLSYVIAAPHTKIGRKYWQSHLYSREWNLYGPTSEDQEPPMLLTDFFDAIKTGMAKDENGKNKSTTVANITPDEIERSYSTRLGGIKAITQEIQSFCDEIRNLNDGKNLVIETPASVNIDRLGSSDEDVAMDADFDNDKIVVMFSTSRTLNVNSRHLQEKYENIAKLLVEYAQNFSGDGISPSMLPNYSESVDNTTKIWMCKSYDMDKYIDINRNGEICVNTGGQSVLIKKDDQYNESFENPETNMARLGGGNIPYSFNSKQSKVIHDALMKYIDNNVTGKSGILYANVIVFSNYIRLTKTLTDLDKRLKECEKKIQDKTLIDIKEFTKGNTAYGISPYIGNYYRMVFCHIETFLYTLKTCADNIYEEISEGMRSPEKLGIMTLDSTDVPSDLLKPGVNRRVVGMPPFPAIYAKEDGGVVGSGDMGITKTIGWVGDVKGEQPWREQELIDEYYDAIRRIASNTKNDPWTDFDDDVFNFNLIPFFANVDMGGKLFTTRDGFAYYVTILSTLVTCMANRKGQNISPDEAGIIGAIIAKKLYDSVDDKERIVNRVEGDDCKQELYKMATVTDTNGERSLFEWNRNGNDRHHILVADGDDLKYRYMMTSASNVPIVPLDNIKTWNELQTKYKTHVEDNHSVSLPHDGCEYVTTDCFDDGKPGIVDDAYVNNHMFTIMLDACNVANMTIEVNDYVESGKDIGAYDKGKVAKNIVDKYWYVDDNFDCYHSVKPEELKPVGLSVPKFTTDELSEEDKKLFDENIRKIKDLEY